MESGLGVRFPASIGVGYITVLILVLVESGLGGCEDSCREKAIQVLILVLVESGLGETCTQRCVQQSQGLNPCFSGKWSWRNVVFTTLEKITQVLILVLVESGLGERCFQREFRAFGGLNPCFSGKWSWRENTILL